MKTDYPERFIFVGIHQSPGGQRREREEVFCPWVGVGSDGWTERLVPGSANLPGGPPFSAISESLWSSSKGLEVVFEKLPGNHSFREDFKGFQEQAPQFRKIFSSRRCSGDKDFKNKTVSAFQRLAERVESLALELVLPKESFLEGDFPFLANSLTSSEEGPQPCGFT